MFSETLGTKRGGHFEPPPPLPANSKAEEANTMKFCTSNPKGTEGGEGVFTPREAIC